MTHLIDTNFLARLLVQDNSQQLQEVLDFIDKAVTRNDPLVVDKMVVFELVYVLSGKIYQLTKTEVKDKVLELMDLSCFTFEDSHLISKALKLFAEHSVDIADAYLITKAV